MPQDKRSIGHYREKTEIVQATIMPSTKSERCFSARNGSRIDVFFRAAAVGEACALELGIMKDNATNAITLNAATPKNGPRQEIAPSSPPSKGPTEIPKPTAASYKIIAFPTLEKLCRRTTAGF